jgi:hypothetical protein
LLGDLVAIRAVASASSMRSSRWMLPLVPVTLPVEFRKSARSLRQTQNNCRHVTQRQAASVAPRSGGRPGRRE